MISVVIPTRNRPTDLIAVLKKIDEQSCPVDEVIVIDSSDKAAPIAESFKWSFELKYKTTKIKSAAEQRNIGIELVSKDCDHLCFLDDDVLPDPQYMEFLIASLNETGGVGVSGVAVNPSSAGDVRAKPSGLFGVLQKFFKLDSAQDGILLKSGVNIPVRSHTGEICEVQWLIGCSIWKFAEVASLRFESDFKGQSLGEDVIYSFRASKVGKLYVNPNVHLIHLESELGRPTGIEFWRMWVVNRSRLVQVSSNRKNVHIEYHLANIGQFLTLIYTGVFLGKTSKFAAFGIFSGYFQLLRNRFSI